MKYQVWILNVDVDVVCLNSTFNVTYTQREIIKACLNTLFLIFIFHFPLFSYLFLNWKTINRKNSFTWSLCCLCTGSAVTMYVYASDNNVMSSQWTAKETQNECIFCRINQFSKERSKNFLVAMVGFVELIVYKMSNDDMMMVWWIMWSTTAVRTWKWKINRMKRAKRNKNRICVLYNSFAVNTDDGIRQMYYILLYVN